MMDPYFFECRRLPTRWSSLCLCCGDIEKGIFSLIDFKAPNDALIKDGKFSLLDGAFDRSARPGMGAAARGGRCPA
jgi:hypothetical protein